MGNEWTKGLLARISGWIAEGSCMALSKIYLLATEAQSL